MLTPTLMTVCNKMAVMGLRVCGLRSWGANSELLNSRTPELKTQILTLFTDTDTDFVEE
jgi:hypothetical protein